MRGKCCGTRVRGSVPQPQSSSLALPCQILVSVDGCQSLAAFGSCIHWMRAPSRRPITPAGTGGKTQGGLPLGNPVCLWQTELFKLNLKSSPSSSGYNRRRRLATGRSGKQQAERTAVRAAPIVCPEESLLGARRRNPPFPDEGLTRRLRRGWWGCRPEGGKYFLSKRKKVPKKARGTATLAARPAMRNSQISAFRALPCPALVFAQACQSLTAFGSCAHWAHAPSRPKLRSALAERLDAPNLFGASNSGR